MTKSRIAPLAVYWRRTWPLHMLLLPAAVLVLIYNYVPMFGLVIAFQDFKPWLGVTKSTWVGLDHFKFLFTYPDIKQVMINTLIISLAKLVSNLAVPLIFALLLNEVRIMAHKRIIQTMVYLPHFLSWVILSGILKEMLTRDGIVNQFLSLFGIEQILFLGDGNWFRLTLVVSDIWKEFGFSAIIYLAALAGINPSLYEAAQIDGANRWQQTVHVTLPGVVPIFFVVATLSLGRVLDAGVDQVLNLYNSMVLDQADIIDTFVYRVGLIGGQFSLGAAVGLFKSVIGFGLIVLAYRLAYRFAGYRLF